MLLVSLILPQLGLSAISESAARLGAAHAAQTTSTGVERSFALHLPRAYFADRMWHSLNFICEPPDASMAPAGSLRIRGGRGEERGRKQHREVQDVKPGTRRRRRSTPYDSPTISWNAQVRQQNQVRHFFLCDFTFPDVVHEMYAKTGLRSRANTRAWRRYTSSKPFLAP